MSASIWSTSRGAGRSRGRPDHVAHPLRSLLAAAACIRDAQPSAHASEGVVSMARQMPEPRPSPLPTGILPLGLSRVAAAFYVGVSPTKFDQMIKDGRMPKP